MEDSYVYRWTHIASGMAYIGKGRGRRALAHTSRTCASLVARAIAEHGRAAFKLDYLGRGLADEAACALERAAIKAFGTLWPAGFNRLAGSCDVALDVSANGEVALRPVEPPTPLQMGRPLQADEPLVHAVAGYFSKSEYDAVVRRAAELTAAEGRKVTPASVLRRAVIARLSREAG